MFATQRYNHQLQTRRQQPKSTFCAMDNVKLPTMGLLVQLSYIILALVLIADFGLCEYENTWNFYYEQPCCGNTNGHHLRHHRGKYILKCTLKLIIQKYLAKRNALKITNFIKWKMK